VIMERGRVFAAVLGSAGHQPARNRELTMLRHRGMSPFGTSSTVSA
jgi:hypothetical protein